MAAPEGTLRIEQYVPVVAQNGGVYTALPAIIASDLTVTGKVGQASGKQLVQSGAVASLGTTQNSTPTAAQLLGGIVTQTSSTGGGTVTTPIGADLSAAISGVAVGDNFRVRFANLGGGQTLTITAGASGVTVVGTATVGTGTNIDLLFVCTGTNTWVVYTNK